jgi:hypothetical protein
MTDLLPDDVNHLTDYIDEKEITKETLKNGLLSFLNYVKEVEDERLHRSE